jgi:hypothetical protein
MNILRQKVEHELDALDNRSMAAAYEHLRLLNFIHRPSRKRRIAAPDIEEVLQLTSSSKGSWSEAVMSNRGCLLEGRSLAFETVLSMPGKIDLQAC